MHSDSRRHVQSFSLENHAGVRAYFDEQGYVVMRGLLSHSAIDTFLEAYRRIKSSRTFLYYAQTIHKVVRPTLNEHGHIVESMQDATRLGLAPRFSGALKKCIYHHSISDGLAVIDGHAKHVSWQDMFFDLSTGTIEHADSWYIDTDPAGSLIGAWMALEDIQIDAGPFFVMPGSHRIKALDQGSYPDHEQFRLATLKQIQEHGFKPLAMPLNKGDVLFWHPSTIHGGFSNKDPRFSRKSLTSHYFPLGARRQREAGLPSVEPTHNPNMLRVRTRPDVVAHLRWIRDFARESRQGTGRLGDMRRRSYR